MQLLFLDKTSMTIGPNSDLTIDEYVYDPNANTGKLAATLGKGALRFVGGQISHNGDAEIKTASALIGIRGGVMMTDGKGGIYAGYGTSTITSGGQTVTLGAGEFTQTQSGGPPTPPGLPPPGFVQQQIAVFQSAVGQSGGAHAGAASQQNVAAAEQKATGSPGGSVTGSNVPTTPPPIAGLISALASAFTQTVQTSTQSAAVQQIVQDQPKGNDNPPPVDNTARPLTGYAAGFDIVYPNQNHTNFQPPTMYPITGTATLNLDATNSRVQGNLDTYIYDSSNPFTQLAGSFRSLFQFGSTGSSGAINSGNVDYNNFYANTPDNYTVNGKAVSGVIVSANGALVNRLIASAIPNLTPCQCDYTRWGFWVVESTGNTNNTGFEIVPGTWVAGRPVGNISDVPTTGTATYTGHVVADVNSAGIVAGGFSNTVNFGAANRRGERDQSRQHQLHGQREFQHRPAQFRRHDPQHQRQRRRPQHGPARQLLPGRAQSGRRNGRKRRDFRRQQLPRQRNFRRKQALISLSRTRCARQTAPLRMPSGTHAARLS